MSLQVSLAYSIAKTLKGGKDENGLKAPPQNLPWPRGSTEPSTVMTNANKYERASNLGRNYHEIGSGNYVLKRKSNDNQA